MKHNNHYEIDFTEGKIIVSKGFLKEAGVIGSSAYRDLVQLRHDYPEFTIVPREINKKKGKKTYGKLTYEKMAEFIKAIEDEERASTVLVEFERVKVLAHAYRGQYAFVKTWFLARYKDQFQQEEDAEEGAA